MLKLERKVKFIEKCLNAGLTYQAIGDILGVTRARIYALITRHEIATGDGLKTTIEGLKKEWKFINR